ncbi:MAG: circadian clock protein KaiB [candidate division Zixibacteria bacterium]|nr:circadian clock protein KaiB [candidate division Zixibacteria bacterium]
MGSRPVIKLKLYTVGNTVRSKRAISNLRRLCDGELKGNCIYEIIDIIDNPEVAEKEKIVATPALVKVFPLPARRIIGDLSDSEKVLGVFGIEPNSGGGSND